MEGFDALLYGFQIALKPVNIWYAFLGVTFGTIIGVLPGIGPVTGIAILLPLTFGKEPTSALILLAGIYYGAMYGGSTTSILFNIPGESASVMTAVEGYELAKKGRAAPALGMSAIGSFMAGTVGLVLLGFFAPKIAGIALRFGPPEYFCLLLCAYTLVAALSTNNIIKGLISVVVGMFITTIGMDDMTGEARFTFGITGLIDGIDFIVVAIGLFAVAEIMINLECSHTPIPQLKAFRLRQMLPTVADWKESIGPIIRATITGFVIGVLPGGGATVTSFIVYGMEKSISKHPENFGTGVMGAVASVESSNNAASAGAFVPLLTLGIPGSGSTAILLAGFMLLGVTPGPTLFTFHPDVVWGLIASMYIGNVMLLILNLPLIGVFIQILRLPYSVMAFFVVVFSVLGAYSMTNDLFMLWILLIFGIVGYIMRKFDFPLAPMLLGVVLGGMTESNFRQSLSLSEGSWMIFLQRPLSLAFLVITLIALLFQIVLIARHGTRRSFESDET